MTYTQAYFSLSQEDRRLLFLDELSFGTSFIRIIDGKAKRVDPKDIPDNWRDILEPCESIE
jgi:hypothetical protein